MGHIHALDQQTANSIAAGEVVERPASVVKELVENSLDAQATVIHVQIRQGGVRRIRVSDNGIGMDEQDAKLAFGRHTTSKLMGIEDLDHLSSMGFRGEALASIAAVAKVKLETRQPGQAHGYAVKMQGGETLSSGTAGCPEGTTMTVDDLFFNVPARFKFLRKDATEAGVITDMIMRLSLARPDVSFRLLNGEQEVLHTPGNNDLDSTLYALFGSNIAAKCLPVDQKEESFQITGRIGRPEIARSNRSQQVFLVNQRVIRSRILTAALDEAYKTLLMKRRYPFAVLLLQIPPRLVDINVHPQKMEVRFWNEQAVFRGIYHAVKQVLLAEGGLLRDEMQEKDPASTSEDSKDETARYETTDKTQADTVATAPIEGEESRDIEAPPSGEISRPTPSGQDERQPPLYIADRPQEEDKTSDSSRPAALKPPEKSAEEILKITALKEARRIGQLFGTYILLEFGDDFLLVDQHAAHEKILFESFVKQSQSSQKPVARQTLLVPQTMQITAHEMQIIVAEQAIIEALGFEFEPFGPNEIIIRAQPDGKQQTLETEKAFRLVLDALLQDGLEQEDQIERLYYDLACKAAVKAHDRLQPQEVEKLLSDLSQLENPYQCPHGRPILIRIGRQELEKRFKRIV